MAQIVTLFALNLTVGAVILGLNYALRVWWLARRRKTYWHICLVRFEEELSLGPEDGCVCVVRTEIMWATSLPEEEALAHLPMVGSKWGDYMVESVYSSKQRHE